MHDGVEVVVVGRCVVVVVDSGGARVVVVVVDEADEYDLAERVVVVVDTGLVTGAIADTSFFGEDLTVVVVVVVAWSGGVSQRASTNTPIGFIWPEAINAANAFWRFRWFAQSKSLTKALMTS